MISIRIVAYVVLLAACSSGVNHPTIVISEARTYAERTEHGNARVFSEPSPHVRLAGARAWLLVAEALSGTPAQAYEAAVRGAKELGPDYAARGTREETHLKEWSAQEKFDKQEFASAAELMIRVLRSRISMYEQKYSTEVE
jgi:hypothetical protein